METHVESADRLSHQHERTFDPGTRKERVEFLGDPAARVWPGTRIAPSVTGSIVGADSSELRDFGLYGTPFERAVREPRLRDDRWAALAGASDVESMAVDIHEFPRRRIPTAISCVGCRLVHGSGGGRRCKSSDHTAE
jgi:hypothetical protein